MNNINKTVEGNNVKNQHVGYLKNIYILDDFEQYMKDGYESIYLQWRSKQEEPLETRIKENERYSLLLKLKEKYGYGLTSCQDFYYTELIKRPNKKEYE